GLIINAIRNASMTRRLTYTMLSKAYGSAFAKSAYDDAKEKAHRELLPKQRTVEGHVTTVDEQALS
ncbi:MAG: hypothetical protein J2P37_31315, partial [Ktedonobacteraceae bacterium]|nr:hypothetical protein [Ktedonobacteraceae bacterium]